MAMKPTTGKNRYGRWYGSLTNYKGETGRVQIGDSLRRGQRLGLRLPEPVLRMAQAEYDIQYPGQPYERMQERTPSNESERSDGGVVICPRCGKPGNHWSDGVENYGYSCDGYALDRPPTNQYEEPTTLAPPATAVTESPQGQ